MFRTPRTVRIFGAVLAAVSIVISPFQALPAYAQGETPGTLDIRAQVSGAYTVSDEPGNLWYYVAGALASAHGRFFTGERVKYLWAPGPYQVTGDGPDGWYISYSGDCDETGKISIVSGEEVHCTVAFSDENPLPGEEFKNVGGAGPESVLIVQKQVVGEERRAGEMTPYNKFSFSLDGQERPFWDAGVNAYPVEPGDYTITETPMDGYEPAYGGDCDEHGRVSVPQSRVLTCTITNTLAAGARPVPSITAPTATETPSPATPVPAAVVQEGVMAVNSDSLPFEETAAVGLLADVLPCGPGDAGRIIVHILLAGLIVFFWRGRPRSVFWQAAILLALLIVLTMAWAGACGLDPGTWPVLISVAAWILLRFLGRR